MDLPQDRILEGYLCWWGGTVGYGYSYTTYDGKAGTPTSFGSYLTANGGKYVGRTIRIDYYMAGFCLSNPSIYGTYTSTIMSFNGYGASGKGINDNQSSLMAYNGDYNIGIFEINKGDSILCTIGEALAPEKTGSNDLSENLLKNITGTNGAIILQYMGEV